MCNNNIETVYSRYLHTKNRYLSLQNMVGGGNKPHVFSLKDLNLFTDEHIRSHLDPTYGFIYASLHYIKNVYILKNGILPVDKKIIDLIKKTFRLVGGQIQPVKRLSTDLKPIEVGRFLAHQYVINNILDDRINDLNKKVKIITDHLISAKADKKKELCIKHLLIIPHILWME